MTRRHRTSPFVPLLVLLVTCGLLPSHLAAQDNEINVTIQVAQEPGQVSQVSSLSQGADFTVRPSSPTEGTQTLNLFLRCLNSFTGQIIPFCNVNLTWEPRANSGGHNHDGGRPKGTFQPSSGNTGSSGVLPTTYTSPQPSGIIDITVRGTTSDGRPVNPASYTIGVEVPGLVNLGAGANYNLIGATPTHGDNHYGTPTFTGMLRTLADSYIAVSGQRLSYNDMSLPQGGLFDIRAGWAPPHREHRLGQSCDLHPVPPQQRRRLQQLLIAGGFGPTLDEGNHWHLRE